MQEIKTNDGSFTYLNKEVNEFYNPLTGAIDRAFKVYINQIDFSKYKEIKVLDIGFGLGYNSLCMINECLKNKIKPDISAIEKDDRIIDKIQRLYIPDYLVYSYELLLEGIGLKELKSDKINFKLFVDDVFNVLDKLNDKFDIILLDPFSFSKNRELYGKELLLKLKKLFNKYGFLICYNSNPVFVNNLLENGFYVKKFNISKREQGIMASTFVKFELENKDIKLARAFGSYI